MTDAAPDPGPVFDQVNLVVRDMDAALAFYARLGLDVGGGAEWPRGSGARHADAAMAGAITLELDNPEMAAIWHAGVRGGAARIPRAVLGFSLDSRAAVDTKHDELVAAGYESRQPPYDAFWGSRYAIVSDPDGNDVGLMSPRDDAKRSVPDV
jgi:uncharacterized glyoxalase superfamily protein PhnB